MAYTPPPTWQHGDFPTAAQYNAMKASLDALHAQIGDNYINPAVCHRKSTVQGFYIDHQHQYLHYLIEAPDTDGSIEDPAGVGETVTLPVEVGYVYYDLSTVDWLTPGKWYQVQGVTTCREHYSSL